ncbi:tyrosine-type recombinase/integrase [Mobiluncus mulieris]|uniref:Tyrosine-type recombinase/integrase n=1 Tax=Mobiluncus mulieris TaxID=2052 RepID=A0A7Y0USH2_9ACTO|nr:tyrosine-type recombinase/integrase [Mobiluncus mulieris]
MYDLRHTAICIWLAAGIDLATVRAWAGHADLTTTSRYTHWLGTKADQTSLATLNQAIKNRVNAH